LIWTIQEKRKEKGRYKFTLKGPASKMSVSKILFLNIIVKGLQIYCLNFKMKHFLNKIKINILVDYKKKQK